MDRVARTADIIRDFYEYKRTGQAAPFIKQVCRYFDSIKEYELQENDITLLLFLANEAGLPQYYDLLKNKYTSKEISEENINLLALSAYMYDSSLITNGTKLHRYQKQVLERFELEAGNRYVLTAPTSFGKTYIVFEIINKLKYRNVLLIFPSISLLSENYGKLRELDSFSDYRVHTLSEEEYLETDKNIFIFTPERYLSFLDKNKLMRFDFAFVDEVYKIDNSFIIDQETTGENERDIAYRLALEYICRSSTDLLLAGPYMTLPERTLVGTESFINFAEDNSFQFLVYNDFEIVDKTYDSIKGRQTYEIDGRSIPIGNIGKVDKIANIIEALSTATENTIIYCGQRAQTEAYAKALLANQTFINQLEEKYSDTSSKVFSDFINHLEQTFGSDWIVVNALKNHIGIHHSLIPKYIQKEIISLFNQGALVCLFSTTTITEGVNTTAKNMIVTSVKKGTKPLKQFDAKNIAGRAGRFFQHYIGRVISVDNNFIDIINGKEDTLKHKNYDEQSQKTDVDYLITKDQYLSKHDLADKKQLIDQIMKTNIPSDVFNAFRIVGSRDKLQLYEKILSLKDGQIKTIRDLSVTLAQSKASRLNWNGFQIIMDTILPIVNESKLKDLIEFKVGKAQEHSLVTVLLSSYLKGGFLSMIDYYTVEKESPLDKDKAIRRVSDYVYNVFKYHLVKYLGLFDVFYRYNVSLRTNRNIEDVPGIAILLQKLEYNALNPNARRLSDFGVPFRLVSYYDQDSLPRQKRFDAYESYIDNQIQVLIK